MNNSNILYDNFAPYYDIYSETRKNYIDSIDKIILNGIPENAENILDIGCGNGKRGYEIFKKSHCKRLMMIDNSPEMIKLADKYQGKNIHIAKTDINNLKANETYDIIWSLWNVLGHIPTYQKRLHALRTMKKLLKPQGIIFIDVSNRYNTKHYGVISVMKNLILDLLRPSITNGDFSYQIAVSPSVKLDSTCHFFTPLEMRRMIETAGLKIKSLYYIDYESGKRSKTLFEGQLFYKLSDAN